MDHSLHNTNVDTIDNPSQEVVDELVEIIDQVAPASQIVPSYRPTQWAVVNATLDRVDVITKGRAGSLMKFATFLVIGGFTSVVSLVVSHLIWTIPMSVSPGVENEIGVIIGTEISLIINFMLNDRFTFNEVAQHDRPYLARFGRFQITGSGGFLLTTLIQALFFNLLHWNQTVALAISIIIVLFYNFAFHHFFTYRHIKAIEEAA